jgi:branched-chain amino acid transport system ATP-binding protein
VGESIALFRRLNAQGLTFLIIEHNLKVVRAFSERVIVLDHGVKIAEGNAEEILKTPEVIRAYVGKRKA